MAKIVVDFTPAGVEKLYRDVQAVPMLPATTVAGFSEARFDKSNLKANSRQIKLMLRWLKTGENGAAEFIRESYQRAHPKRVSKTKPAPANALRLLVLMGAALGAVRIEPERAGQSSQRSVPSFSIL